MHLGIQIVANSVGEGQYGQTCSMLNTGTSVYLLLIQIRSMFLFTRSRTSKGSTHHCTSFTPLLSALIHLSEWGLTSTRPPSSKASNQRPALYTSDCLT
jgi:hypothetical protein